MWQHSYLATPLVSATSSISRYTSLLLQIKTIRRETAFLLSRLKVVRCLLVAKLQVVVPSRHLHPSTDERMSSSDNNSSPPPRRRWFGSTLSSVSDRDTEDPRSRTAFTGRLKLVGGLTTARRARRQVSNSILDDL